ncbi:sugar transporter [Histoplasma capsulatum G186AR]|uniref:Sugar transporter n=1 Tax=Ajellomyces capsulatus (strain G186AR / H82 / ATCC MYA-2454 / RMSCC 2432) TaxID=447093 RepID=C0NXK5_AJECG|nr:sugar transporter [Histoplasma capsulatum G186AR]EEH04071.1 sugar transporter [Histoplasma capsulatum G186AR]
MPMLICAITFFNLSPSAFCFRRLEEAIRIWRNLQFLINTLMMAQQAIHSKDASPPEEAPVSESGGFHVVFKNPYLFGVALLILLQFTSLGGLLFGYDQGVVSGVLTMESFGALFPRIYSDSSFKGWFVSTLLLAAWLGSLVNGPFADYIGRKLSIIVAVVVFLVGSAIQAGAVNLEMLFVVSITVGILLSYWIDYGTNYIGGSRCAPNIPHSGGTPSSPAFDPYNDVGPNGCDGQSDASWRIPFALQIIPAIILGAGMILFPDSPRWLLMKDRDEDALATLGKLRRQPTDDPTLVAEYLEIKASVIVENTFAAQKYAGMSGAKLHAAQYYSLVSTWPRFERLSIGCCVMFFQQFMGCNAMIYYAPTIFSQLGLDGNTTSLLATGVYGIVNCLSTLPALFWIDKVGRRVLLMCGATGTCISLVIVGAIIGKYGSALVDHADAGWAGIAFIYIYDINFSYSFAPIGWVLPSEIFNLSIRSKAISITTSTTWMCNFIIGLVTPDMLESITWGTYIFFAAFCMLALAFTFFFVPETRGKHVYLSPVKPIWSASPKVPSDIL